MQIGGFRCLRPRTVKSTKTQPKLCERTATDADQSVTIAGQSRHDDGVTQGGLAELAATRIELLVQALGKVTLVAECLRVSRPLVSNWRSGTHQSTAIDVRLLIDLDQVVARASIIFAPSVVWDWLRGSNDYLEGARPIDVLHIRGVNEVLEALGAAEQKAFG
jgi:hypothetical protein